MWPSSYPKIWSMCLKIKSQANWRNRKRNIIASPFQSTNTLKVENEEAAVLTSEKPNAFEYPLAVKEYKEEDQPIISAIYKAFEELDNQYRDFVRTGYGIGHPQLARPGACALVSINYNDKIYVANLGDSQGMIIRNSDKVKKNSALEKLNDKFNIYDFSPSVKCLDFALLTHRHELRGNENQQKAQRGQQIRAIEIEKRIPTRVRHIQVQTGKQGMLREGPATADTRLRRHDPEIPRIQQPE